MDFSGVAHAGLTGAQSLVDDNKVSSYREYLEVELVHSSVSGKRGLSAPRIRNDSASTGILNWHVDDSID
jgi:hypothetical protein